MKVTRVGPAISSMANESISVLVCIDGRAVHRVDRDAARRRPQRPRRREFHLDRQAAAAEEVGRGALGPEVNEAAPGAGHGATAGRRRNRPRGRRAPGQGALPECLVAIHRMAELVGIAARTAGCASARWQRTPRSAPIPPSSALHGARGRIRDRRLACDARARHARRQPDERLAGDGDGWPAVCLDATATLRSRERHAQRRRGRPVHRPRRTRSRTRTSCSSASTFRPRPPAPAAPTSALEYRRQMEIAVVGATAVVTLDGDGASRDARVAITALAPTVRRVPEAEAALAGTTAASGGRGRCGRRGRRRRRSPMSAHQTDYRRAMAAVIARRAIGVPCPCPRRDRGGPRQQACAELDDVAASSTVNGSRTGRARARPSLLRPARRPGPHGLQGGLRRLGVRRLHDAARRAAPERLLLPGGPGGRPRGDDRGGPGRDDDLSPLQAAFLAHGGVQCGFCTPGMLISATALLARPRPERGRGPRSRCPATSAAAPATRASSRLCWRSPSRRRSESSGRVRRREQRLDAFDRPRICQTTERHGRPTADDILGRRRPTRAAPRRAPARRCPASPDGSALAATDPAPPSRRRSPRGCRRGVAGALRPPGPNPAGSGDAGPVAPGSRNGRRSSRRSPSGPRMRSSASRAIFRYVVSLPPATLEHPGRPDREDRLAAGVGRRPVAEREHAEPGERRAHRVAAEQRGRERRGGLGEDLRGRPSPFEPRQPRRSPLVVGVGRAEQILAEAATALPSSLLGRDAVRASFAGLRVLPLGDGATANARRETVFSIGPAGMLSVAGGKLTTYRKIALDALERIRGPLGLRRLDRRPFLLPGATGPASPLSRRARPGGRRAPATPLRQPRGQPSSKTAAPGSVAARADPSGRAGHRRAGALRGAARVAATTPGIVRRRTTVALRGLADPGSVERVEALLAPAHPA